MSSRAEAWLKRTIGRTRSRLGAPRRLSSILARLEESGVAQRGSLRIHDVRVTRSGVVICQAGPVGEQTMVVKLARTASAGYSLRREARVLTLVHCFPSLAGLAPLTPTPILRGGEAGWQFVVLSRLPGKHLVRIDQQQPETLRDALAVIGRLHRGTMRQIYAGDVELQRWIHCRAATISALLGGRYGGREVLVALESELRQLLDDQLVEVAWIHGDYWPGNVLVSEAGSILGVLDWDSVRRHELPVHDLLHFLLTTRRLQEGRPWGSIVGDLLKSPRWTDSEQEYVAQLEASAPLGSVRAALLLYWLQVVESNLRRHPAVTSTPRWLSANVNPVLESVA
jgi:hypothetical protein